MKRKAEEQARQLEDEAGLSPAEATAVVVPEGLASDEAAADVPRGRGLTVNTDRYAFAQDYVHAVSPEGTSVVFVPGELLPEWAAEAQARRTNAVLNNLNLLGPADAPDDEGKRPVKSR